jgi:hypothetical protein
MDSAEDFLTKSPLYIAVRVNGFIPPSEISFDCDGKCGKETTWGRVSSPLALGDGRDSQVADWKMESVAYRCLRCKQSVLTVIYREMKEEERVLRSSSNLSSPPSKTRVVVEVAKVGQYPAPSIALPKGLEKGLGKEAAELYRRALVCRNSGYGLAAVGYMRRVVVNPLQVLFGLVSKGLHGLSEPQCIEVADGIRDVFEYVFEKLKTEVAAKRAFAEKLKKLSQP